MTKKFGESWIGSGGYTDMYGDYGKEKKSWLDNIHDKYGGTKFKSCFESHPPLVLGGFKVYGGSCSRPIVKDADIYIGFDLGMTFVQQYPWEEGKKIEQFLYSITDGQPPTDPASFKKMIEWAAMQVAEGKKLHAGCIGGHGRTGTFLAALTFVFTGEKDAITFVRENYCKKVVETSSQVQFLNKHYGIKVVTGSHSEKHKGYSGASYNDAPVSTASSSGYASKFNNRYGPKANKSGSVFSNAEKEFAPMTNSTKCLW